jgi:hypothetical protein
MAVNLGICSSREMSFFRREREALAGREPYTHFGLMGCFDSTFRKTSHEWMGEVRWFGIGTVQVGQSKRMPLVPCPIPFS